MHLLITRPEPDAGAFRAQLEALGHTVTVEPLLHIEPLPIAADAIEGVAGLVVTSRNGLRALSSSQAFNAALKLPTIAVGPGTARLARDLGFEHVIAESGSAADLEPIIIEVARELKGTLAHVRGEEVAFDLEASLSARGISLRNIVAYRAVPANALGPKTKELLAAGSIDAVILMSPRTGAIFVRLVRAEGLAGTIHRLVLMCLSPAVAAAVEVLAPSRLEVAESPNSTAMLAAVSRVATLWSGV
jgi:uroporphyrinogen-III synthase